MSTLFSDGCLDMRVKIGAVVGNEIGQVAVLGVVPDLFGRVEVWGVGGEPFDPDACTVAVQILAHDFGPMDVPTIQDEDEFTLKTASDPAEKVHNVRSSNVFGLHVPIQTQPAALRGDGDGADDRQPVVTVPCRENRRLSSGCPSPADHRLEHEATLVNKDDATALPPGVFLYAAIAAAASARFPLRPARGRGVDFSMNCVSPTLFLWSWRQTVNNEFLD